MHKTFKVCPAGFDVQSDSLLLNVRILADYHDISGSSKLIDETDELLVAHDHRLELVVRLYAGQLELFDDV